jgi:hypothetical protein
MTPNQARLVRFHLGFTGWQSYGPQSRAAAARLADSGILERGGKDGRQFRLALGAYDRRALDAAPAMLAALESARDQMEQCESMFRDDAEFIAALDEVRAAIDAATGERS